MFVHPIGWDVAGEPGCAFTPTGTAAIAPTIGPGPRSVAATEPIVVESSDERHSAAARWSMLPAGRRSVCSDLARNGIDSKRAKTAAWFRCRDSARSATPAAWCTAGGVSIPESAGGVGGR